MWLFTLLLGIALGTNAELKHGAYLLDIDDDGLLKSIKPTGDVSDIDLANLGLKRLGKNAFDALVDAKSLNLANNSLDELPEFVFANLTKLEKLSLANNQLSGFENAFVGLNDLKVLNISNNPIRHLRKSFFFSLTKATDIITAGNELWSVSTVLFENPFLREVVDEEPKEEQEEASDDSKGPTPRSDYDSADGPLLSRSLEVKICITSGLVKTVEHLAANEVLENGCKRADVNYEERTLVLKNLGVERFRKGWYNLAQFPINSIDLTANKISDITPEILNDLPEGLAYVNFGSNKIEKLKRNVIRNDYLKVLNLKDNLIAEIEEEALKNTNLSGFFAIGNRLESLGFAASFPPTLTEMIVSQNQLEGIPDDALVQLKNLVYLNVAHNNITKLTSQSLRGLSSLQVLILTNNKLREIEAGAFQDLISLRTLYVYRNSIPSLESGVWRGLENLKDLNLAWNKLTKVTGDTFLGLPETLRDLHVDYNEIEALEVGSFVRVPKFTLSLDGNRITSIPRGTFDLPHLHELHLKNNTLKTIDGNSFAGLPRLRRLSLTANQITTVEKGAASHMGRIHLLDISKNPIEELRNGALFGMLKSKGSFVYVSDTRLKLIQGGLFEDV